MCSARRTPQACKGAVKSGGSHTTESFSGVTWMPVPAHCLSSASYPSWVTPGRRPSGRLQKSCAAHVEFTSSTARRDFLRCQAIRLRHRLVHAGCGQKLWSGNCNGIGFIEVSQGVHLPAACSCSCRSEVKAPTPAVGSSDTGSCSTRACSVSALLSLPLPCFLSFGTTGTGADIRQVARTARTFFIHRIRQRWPSLAIQQSMRYLQFGAAADFDTHSLSR